MRATGARLRTILPHGVMLLVACFLYWAAGRIDAPTGGRIGPDVWPKAVIVFMGLLCAFEIAKRLLVRPDVEARGLLATSQRPEGERREEPAENHRMLAAGIALIAGYVVVVPWTGFFIATAIFLALFQWAGGLRRPVLSAVTGVAGSLVLVVVFMRVAYISLPLGEGPFRSLSIALMRAIGVT